MAEFSDIPEGFKVKQEFSDIPEGFKVAEPTQLTSPALAHPVAKFALGTKLGLDQAKAGAAQFGETIASGVRGLFTDEEQGTDIQDQLSAEIAARDEKLQRLGPVAQAGGMVGEVLPSMALPGGPTGGLVRRVAGGAAFDAATSLADPVREDQTRTGNVATTAAFGGTMRGVGAAISPLVRRLSNARAGEFQSDEVRSLIRQADAEDIRIFFDDVTQSTAAQKASVAAETFGMFGTAPGRRGQGEDALAAAERWLKNYAGDSDNYAEIVQSGLKRKLHIFQRAASKKYGRVAEIIQRSGPVQPVTTTKFDGAIQSAIDKELAKGGRANSAVVSKLESFRDSARGDFDHMIEFRSDLNDDISNLYNGESAPNHSTGELIRSVQDALDTDMTDFATKHGAADAWRAANKFYADTVTQFKKGKLKALVNERSAANFDEQAAWRYLTQQTTNPTRARNMWQALDSRGRAAVRSGFLEEALDAATRDGRPFSPARYASFIEKRIDVADQFFRGRSGEEIKGFVKVLRHIERAGQFAENPPTGNRLIVPLIAGGVGLEPGVTSVAVGASSAVKGLFQSEAGRNFLLAANKATEGSKQMDAILDQMAKLTARSSNQER